jgi:4-aminobutyrate aminotransferase-like enzyme/Ser/Thr protein kinase RdoA (MazF antagonist)
MLHVKYDLPRFSADDAVAMALRHYGLVAAAQPLPSERDQNFLLAEAGGERFVLKIANAAEDPAVLDLQNKALQHIAAREPSVHLPRVRPASTGEAMLQVSGAGSASHLVRLLSYVPGQTLASTRAHTSDLLASLGRLLATIDRALLDFDHPADDRPLKWDLRRAAWIREYLRYVEPEPRRSMVERILDGYEREVRPRFAGLRTSVIYNDANDHNVIVGGEDAYTRRVVAVVDFGDLLRSCTVAELAVASAYAMLGKPDPLQAAAAIVRAYHSVLPIGEDEIEVLYPLILTRLAVSVVNSAFQRAAEPGNEYLTISEAPAWSLLERLDATCARLAHYEFRAACGLPAHGASVAVTAWLDEHEDQFAPLLEPDPRAAAVRVLDLRVAGSEAGTPDLWANPRRFSRDLMGRVFESGASIGVGRYNEARPFYSSSIFRTEGNEGPVWRTVHLGLDLFVEAGRAVCVPIDGVVHSFANNAGPLDYGPTVILEHPPTDKRPGFYTLYGHLSLDSLNWLHQGRQVSRGARLGEVGDYAVNGGWPPHLHFQIITDMLDRRGDFPGVARPDQRDVWLNLCPDPNLMARIPGAGSAPVAGLPADEILESRSRHIGASLSVSYRRPLKIVRGYMQHLYDEEGRAYLDGVNNVPHVGHCHPRVVEAGQRQMALLNTNTRYLHELLVRYAERLCSMLPDPLRVCYFVNSGSEANELALRLARVRTGSRATIVVDVGYHGNTSGLIEISPYKFNGPGGSGAPDHVIAVPTPDVYRGAYRENDPASGAHYAAAVSDAVVEFERRGAQVGAFIAESLLSCAGQIVLPDGYLTDAYRRVRQAGGVCIADEVQVGFGRVGTHMWAFQAQDVVPDIVTMGKPIGNGHPLGAVITTPEIAAAFANGMEYFNTFGGNPVSCAIGMAVLDVMEQEHLQQRAGRVGSYLLDRLRGLMPGRALIGDVRGAGLFIGVELVRDRATREPAGEAASYVANRMRDGGVLVSTDGPHHNVLKIKPPMVFGESDADELVAAMDRALGEIEP